MKKKSASQSAFFNLRVLTGLLLVLTGVFLALLGFGAFSAFAANMAQSQQKQSAKSIDPLVPAGFDCSKIRALGIDKQENFRAGALMIFCGEAAGGSASAFGQTSPLVQELLAPLFGGADVDLVTGAENSPNITQSETYSLANPDNPDQILVTYNDSRGRDLPQINISGASVSTDGGSTFTRLTNASGQSPFSNTLGDPVSLYNKNTQTWFAIFLDVSCGGQGIGGYKSTTPWDPNSWTHLCIHSGSSDDRESGWSDNNPASPHYGNMYVSWNDFADGGSLRVRFSTDDGATWTDERQLAPASPFIRDVQITGDFATGDLYVAGMDEGGGGFPHNDINHIYRSTDGGNTWTHTYAGPSFPGPGVTTCPNPYFACMFPDTGGYWRHEGWGEPAAFNGLVHLVYAQHGSGSDPGDVYYIRSTDKGETFGAPVKLNTDATTRPQWQPNLSVSPAGTLLSVWYDARATTNCQKGNPAVPCYQMWARKSVDNGATWLADEPFSDVVTPLPGQSDPGIIAEYAGDYDYGSSVLSKHVSAWADGRVPIAGQSQQDAFTDRELVGFSVTSTDPACGSIINTQPTDFVVNLSDPAVPSSVQASDFTVNGTPANSFVLSNGNATITFHFNSSPVVTQGLQTMHIPAGAFNRASDNQANFEFNCTFCYAIMPLQVTTTVPPVGGTFSPEAPGDYQYDVNFNQAVDPASVQTSDLTLTGDVDGSVTAVSVINGNMTARFTLHFNFGGSVTASIGAGAITALGCNVNVAFSGEYTVEGCPPEDYTIATTTGTIIPGGVDIGNHCDDCNTQVNLPFPVSVYGNPPISVASVGSNSGIQFTTTPSTEVFWWPGCVPIEPDPAEQGPFLNTLFPYYDDLRTDELGVCPDCGIFTQTVGTPPNRQFVIRWKTTYFNHPGTAEFEVLLTEGSDTLSAIYGASDNNGAEATSGIQQDLTRFTSFSCAEAVLTPGLRVNYIPTGCGGGGDLNLVSAASVKGPFAIDLPLSGPSGVEDRSGGPNKKLTAVMTFDQNITSVGSASSTCGTVQSIQIDNADPHNVRVNLVNVAHACNGSTITVTAESISDDQGNVLDSASVGVGLLLGDVNADRVVNRSDTNEAQTHKGQKTDQGNFRSDVNADGRITKSDIELIRQQQGTSLP